MKKRYSGGRDYLNSKKGFLSDKLLLFKTSAATLLPEVSNMPTSMKRLDLKQKINDRLYGPNI